MKYYKVVKSKHKKLYSTCAMNYEQIRYIKNKWVVPREECNQWLYVFNDLDAALFFQKIFSMSNDLRVYECKIGKIVTCWKTCIEHAVLTDKVKILKRIK